ncbi:MAG: glycosyltransferase family 39 protein [Chitinophagaceae bacterium]|nr:glycosyltransferase family 39 protein [Chitinophagaceae bacterium]
MISNRLFYFVLLACGFTALLGVILVPLMDIDASQYASISREMLDNKSYLQLFDQGHDYLDKPPMLFWLSAISMKLLGVYDWSYRLPSFLFAMLAVYATYQFALLFYRKEIAQLSAMVLAGSQALFLVTHDVRCDTMLMGWVAFSLWQMAAWYQTNHWKHFLLAFIAIAGGMMTKGPIALMVPVFGLVPHFILRREWKRLFRWEYLLGAVLIAILLVPMSMGLYQQFDQHPGKLINGVAIQSGLRFYYWTQSFGRYTGENVFNEMNHFTFLLENMFWSFLPWIFFFLIGLVLALKEIISKKFRLAANEEWITTGGFIITYCILARSQAQLPHYIFVVFPLAAVITAKFLYRLLYTDGLMKWRKPLLIFHSVIFALLWVAVIALMALPFKEVPVYVVILAVSCLLFFFRFLFYKPRQFPVLLTVSLYTVLGVNIFLTTNFYPNLLQYQLGNVAGKFIHDHAIPKDKISLYGVKTGRSLSFYGQRLFTEKKSVLDFEAADVVLTSKDSSAVFQRSFPKMKRMLEGNHFGVSILTLPFLNPATREKELAKYVIIDLDGKF